PNRLTGEWEHVCAESSARKAGAPATRTTCSVLASCCAAYGGAAEMRLRRRVSSVSGGGGRRPNEVGSEYARRLLRTGGRQDRRLRHERSEERRSKDNLAWRSARFDKLS